jgi:hypothetical protein
MQEVWQSGEMRSLSGFKMIVEGQGKNRRLTSLRLANDQPLDPAKRYRIALNTFDARSAGHRFMKLRSILEHTDARCTFHCVQTRETLIDYFRRHKVVHRLPRAGSSKAATWNLRAFAMEGRSSSRSG